MSVRAFSSDRPPAAACSDEQFDAAPAAADSTVSLWLTSHILSTSFPISMISVGVT
jgi:hypothetical protein